MRYRLLGSLEVARDDGSLVAIPAAKRRALLAILLLQRGQPIQREALIDSIWGDEAPDAASESLFAHVSRLRRDLGADVVQTVPGGYVLPLRDGELDVMAFEREVADGRQALAGGQWFAATTSLGAALERWRGAPLGEFAAEPFAQPELSALEELRLSALEDRVTADLALRRHRQLVPELEKLVQLHPLRERLWGQLMLALYRSGRQSDALDRYLEVRRILQTDLGIDPSPELQHLQGRILRQDPDLVGGDVAGRVVVDLPTQSTRTIGREAELEAVRAKVGAHRLVTLTGPGGVGKTRLAVLAAEALLPEHPDGTQFVDLSPVRDPSRVLERIGAVLGGGGRPDDVIGSRRMLVILDNFEQVIDASRTVAALLASCPHLRLIVTSRSPLRVAAEHLVEVPPLKTHDAAELFVDRATPAIARESLPDDLVRQVVEKLDGLPLAVELAAARVKVLTLAAIRDFLRQGAHAAPVGTRPAPDRSRTLFDTIRWSYDLLDPAAQAAFRKLGVLAPGFDIEAAIVVGETGMDVITGLVEHHLLTRTGDRYSMLETIRSFAEAAMSPAEIASARDRHMRYFAALPLAARNRANEKARGGETPEFDLWLHACATNEDNLRVAFDRAAEVGDADSIVQLFRGTGTYWAYRGTTEEALRWARLALEASRDRTWVDRDHVRVLTADLGRFGGDFHLSIEMLLPVLDSATERGDLVRLAVTHDDLAGTYGSMGDLDAAMRHISQAHEVHRREEDCGPRHLLHTLACEIETLVLGGRIEEADRKGAEFVALHEAAPSYRMRSLEAELTLAHLAAAAGRRVEARQGYDRVVREASSGQFRWMLSDALDGLAGLDATDQPDRAARLLGMADRARLESRYAVYFRPQREALIERLRDSLGPDAFDAVVGEGRLVAVPAMAAAVRIGSPTEPVL